MTFGRVVMTRMACAPQLMDIEAAFSNVLGSVTRFDPVDGLPTFYIDDTLIVQAQRG